MKNKQIFLALGALLCVAVLLFLLIYFTGNAADDQPEPANETNVNQTQYQDNFTSNPLLSQADSQITADSQAPISSTLADGVMYVVKEYEGIIGCFFRQQRPYPAPGRFCGNPSRLRPGFAGQRDFRNRKSRFAKPAGGLRILSKKQRHTGLVWRFFAGFLPGYISIKRDFPNGVISYPSQTSRSSS